MKTQARWWMLAALAIAALAAIGCAQKKTESETPPAAQQAAPEAAAPGGEAAAREEGGAPVTPAGSVPEIWTQIAGEQARLSAAIENGQLKDVHHLAFGIRDLVVALADQAGASNPAAAAKLKGVVEQVTASAGKLDELGDAGNLSGTQTEYARLEGILKTLRSVTGAT
ncbi:MAG: hypothetical protein HZC42_07990 [Candidatus Eisenbacteria bacterium]|nr:hypothetical protein [Candidatus Eisenbacteria bacterium]